MDGVDELRRQLRPDRDPLAGVLGGAGRWIARGLAFAGLAGLLACTYEAEVEQNAGPEVRRVVDSIFPPEEEIRRFREGLPEVTALSGGAPGQGELVQRFLRAVEEADTAAFAPLVLTRPEFAYLYYPHTVFTRPPYRQSPALVWFQMESNTDRTLTRIFRRLAGAPLHARGYTCEEEPLLEGPNRVWKECRLHLTPPGAEPFEARLFGSIVERGGVFKFVSYASDL